MIAFVSDSAVHVELRRLWLDAARTIGIEPVEVPGHRLALEITDDTPRVLFDGKPFTPDAVVFRSAAIFMPMLTEIAKIWEAHGTVLVNHPTSINIARDKVAAALCMATNGVPVVPSLGFFRGGTISGIADTTVIKPAFGSQGRGVAVHTNAVSALAALGDDVRAKTEQHLVAQPFWGPKGHDLRVFVVAGRCVAAMRRHAPDNGLVNNTSQGGTAEALDPVGEYAELAVRATASLGLDYAGVDIVESVPPRVLEVNALPSFTALHTATGVNPALDIWALVLSRIAERGTQ